jgi:hypothetical protein
MQALKAAILAASFGMMSEPDKVRLLLINCLTAAGMNQAARFLDLMGFFIFRQGSVSQKGVMTAQEYTVDVARNPSVHDIPGQDVTLTGKNVMSRNPLKPYPYLDETGPFKRFCIGRRSD